MKNNGDKLSITLTSILLLGFLAAMLSLFFNLAMPDRVPSTVLKTIVCEENGGVHYIDENTFTWTVRCKNNAEFTVGRKGMSLK